MRVLCLVVSFLAAALRCGNAQTKQPLLLDGAGMMCDASKVLKGAAVWAETSARGAMDLLGQFGDKSAQAVAVAHEAALCEAAGDALTEAEETETALARAHAAVARLNTLALAIAGPAGRYAAGIDKTIAAFAEANGGTDTHYCLAKAESDTQSIYFDIERQTFAAHNTVATAKTAALKAAKKADDADVKKLNGCIQHNEALALDGEKPTTLKGKLATTLAALTDADLNAASVPQGTRTANKFFSTTGASKCAGSGGSANQNCACPLTDRSDSATNTEHPFAGLWAYTLKGSSAATIAVEWRGGEQVFEGKKLGALAAIAQHVKEMDALLEQVNSATERACAKAHLGNDTKVAWCNKPDARGTLSQLIRNARHAQQARAQQMDRTHEAAEGTPQQANEARERGAGERAAQAGARKTTPTRTAEQQKETPQACTEGQTWNEARAVCETARGKQATLALAATALAISMKKVMTKQ
ncbi:hypothetical protein ERJ75_001847400 [Trypanosoma vivax]|nr:hypothetical protein ERJ75_001847400 [Trypanosoma vivax]